MASNGIPFTRAAAGGISLPVGFRFHPTEEELIGHYLQLKLRGMDSLVSDVIREINMCNHEPWDLPEMSLIKSDDEEWYFYNRPIYKKNSRNDTERATSAGFWKITGPVKEVRARDNKTIGKKRILTFYRGRGRNAQITPWVMHEFYIPQISPNVNQRDLVHCHVKKNCHVKKKSGKNTDVATCDEGESSNHNNAPDFENQPHNMGVEEEHNQPPQNLDIFQWHMGSMLANAHDNNDYHGMQSALAANERDKNSDKEFASTLIVNPYQNSSEEMTHTNILNATEEMIQRSKAVIGKKRTLTFYRCCEPKPKKTNWVVHEHYLIDSEANPKLPQKDFVICRMKKKSDEEDTSMGEVELGSCSVSNVEDHAAAVVTPGSQDNSSSTLLSSGYIELEDVLQANGTNDDCNVIQLSFGDNNCSYTNKNDISTCDEGEPHSFTVSDFENETPHDMSPELCAQLQKGMDSFWLHVAQESPTYIISKNNVSTNDDDKQFRNTVSNSENQATNKRISEWVSHRNHRGNICGVDFIWLCNPSKSRKPLKTSWCEAVFGILRLRKASMAENDAFAFLKGDGHGDFITSSAFCEALQVNLIGHPRGLGFQETRELWIQADADANVVLDYEEFKNRILGSTASEDKESLNGSREESKRGTQDALGFNVKNAVLYPREAEKGIWPEDYTLSDHAPLSVVLSPERMWCCKS